MNWLSTTAVIAVLAGATALDPNAIAQNTAPEQIPTQAPRPLPTLMRTIRERLLPGLTALPRPRQNLVSRQPDTPTFLVWSKTKTGFGEGKQTAGSTTVGSTTVDVALDYQGNVVSR